MRRRRTALVTLIAAGLPLLSPALAPAAPARHVPTPPRSGHWVLVNTKGGASKGSFTVTSKHRYVSRLHATIAAGHGRSATCGSGTVTVLGRHRIHLVRGTNPDGSTYRQWVVGHASTPVGVTLSHHGHHLSGRLHMNFVGARGGTTTAGPERRVSAGQIYYNHDTCDLYFGIKKK